MSILLFIQPIVSHHEFLKQHKWTIAPASSAAGARLWTVGSLNLRRFNILFFRYDLQLVIDLVLLLQSRDDYVMLSNYSRLSISRSSTMHVYLNEHTVNLLRSALYIFTSLNKKSYSAFFCHFEGDLNPEVFISGQPFFTSRASL